MTSASKTSVCVSCATPIIGSRRRCSVCNRAPASWLVVAVDVIEVLAIVGLAIFFFVKGCAR